MPFFVPLCPGIPLHAHHAGYVRPDDQDSPEWAIAIAGLIDFGLLTDDVQYGLRLLDSDETTTY